MSSKLSICVVYPDLLGTYGDGGNAVVLSRRLSWRGIANEIVHVPLGETVPNSCDVYLMGGGEDQPQSAVTDQLMTSRSLHRAVDTGAVVLAVCAGMQILGNEFAIAGDRSRAGLGLLDITTVRGEGARRVGELTAAPRPEIAAEVLTGYENHGGVTRLGGDVKALGSVITGHGNDDGQGSEGAVSGRVVGTYLHGPALARNPQLADRLLSWATGKSLDPLDDSEPAELRRERLEASQRRAADSGWREHLRVLLRR